MYVYRQFTKDQFDVGFFFGNQWYADSIHTTRDAAAARVHYLNGGSLHTRIELGLPSYEEIRKQQKEQQK